MGAERDDLRPGYTEVFEMEVETEDELAPAANEAGDQPAEEGEECSGEDGHQAGDQGEDQGEDQREGGAGETESTTPEEEEETKNGETDEKEKGSESSSESDEDSDFDCADGFSNIPILSFDVPLLIPGSEHRPGTPAPGGPSDRCPVQDFWDDPRGDSQSDEKLQERYNYTESWAIRKCFEPSAACYAWPSQVILPQVMVWSRPQIPSSGGPRKERPRATEGKYNNKKIFNSRDQKMLDRLKRLRKSSKNVSSSRQLHSHHERKRDRYYLKALREAVHLERRQKQGAQHLKRLEKYFSKAALDVQRCSCECSCGSSGQDLNGKTGKHKLKNCVLLSKEAASLKLKKSLDNADTVDNEQNDNETAMKSKLQDLHTIDPLENWPVWREYFNKTLKI